MILATQSTSGLPLVAVSSYQRMSAASLASVPSTRTPDLADSSITGMSED